MISFNWRCCWCLFWLFDVSLLFDVRFLPKIACTVQVDLGVLFVFWKIIMRLTYLNHKEKERKPASENSNLHQTNSIVQAEAKTIRREKAALIYMDCVWCLQVNLFAFDDSLNAFLLASISNQVGLIRLLYMQQGLISDSCSCQTWEKTDLNFLKFKPGVANGHFSNYCLMFYAERTTDGWGHFPETKFSTTHQLNCFYGLIITFSSNIVHY